MLRRALLAAALVGGCARDPAPAVVFVGDAGPRRAEEPLDCRTHLAHADTGEVTAKRAPFAHTTFDGPMLVLHEGDAETWRVSLATSDAGASAPPKSAAILARHVIAHDGERATALDRRTGKILWTHAERGARVLALPGELVLVSDDRHVVALGAKKGDEVFRASLPTPATPATVATPAAAATPASSVGAPYVADERLVVVPGAGHLVILDPPLAKGTLAASASRAGSRARYDLPLDALGVVTTRGSLGDAFVVTRARVERVRSEPREGTPTWSESVPFADADTLVVLDAEDTLPGPSGGTMLVLAAYASTPPDRAQSPIHVRVYEVHGDELRARFDASVPRAAKGAKACAIALGRPARDLVVAELCAEGSAVTVLDGATGAASRRADFAKAP